MNYLYLSCYSKVPESNTKSNGINGQKNKKNLIKFFQTADIFEHFNPI
jgi:hypothetical protein